MFKSSFGLLKMPGKRETTSRRIAAYIRFNDNSSTTYGCPQVQPTLMLWLRTYAVVKLHNVLAYSVSLFLFAISSVCSREG